MRLYYEAYDERYKAVHEKGLRWTSDVPTPIVRDVFSRYGIDRAKDVLEIGCGEGRDAVPLLNDGFRLTAADLSPEAIRDLRARFPQYAERFLVLDCLYGAHPVRYDAIYAVAVVHMLTEDADRDAFYRFIAAHLRPDGIALICSMGDGVREQRTDPADAFVLREREHAAGRLRVAATSCRTVAFGTFLAEIERGGLAVAESGLTAAPPEFDSMLYAVVRLSGAQTA